MVLRDVIVKEFCIIVVIIVRLMIEMMEVYKNYGIRVIIVV